jgi:predicted Zn-dependent peptidase
MSSVRSVAVGFWVEAGGIYESDGEEGVAHLLEHLIFKGTRNRSAREIARAIEGRGGHLGAFTEKEFCCYYAVVLDEHLEIAVDVLSDIILNHRFTDDQLAREKAVVLEEFSDLEDSPEELAHELLPAALWPNHPLGTSLLGTRESVSRMTRETVRNYWQELYGPDTITVAAAGHVNPTRLLELVDRYFRYPQNGACAREISDIPNDVSPMKVERRQVGQLHLLIGAKTEGALAESRFPLLVLNAALGGGMGSRMFQVIREDGGLAYSVYSHLTQMRTAGYLGLYLATQPAAAVQATELLTRELVDICRNGITAEELREAKEQIKGALVLSQESTSARMTRLATQELYYRRFMSLDEALKTVDCVSGNDVIRIARLLFMDQIPSVTLVGPVTDEPTEIRERIDSLQSRISEL